jgi:hypothetical protein
MHRFGRRASPETAASHPASARVHSC